MLSPLFADLKGWPPSLLVTSTRDLLLSDTTMFHRALLHEGNDAALLVFEALPHAFWYHFQLPETKEALKEIAHQLKALLVTVAALEAHAAGSGLSGHRYTEAKSLIEQANRETFARLQSLIDKIPNS